VKILKSTVNSLIFIEYVQFNDIQISFNRKVNSLVFKSKMENNNCAIGENNMYEAVSPKRLTNVCSSSIGHQE